jgi:hypothetical protein
MILKRLCAWAAVAACLLFSGFPALAQIKDYVHNGTGISITGVQWVGKTLNANGIPAGGTCAWFSNAVQVSTSCTSYTVVSGDVGHTIKLQVTTAGETIYAAMSFSGTCATSGTQGAAYSGCSYTGPSGGATPYTYSLSGAWPSGISIASSTGVVSGSPSVSGTFNGLSVTAVDNVGGSASIANFNLTIASNFTLTGTPASTGTVGTAYSTFTPTTTGGTAPYTYALTGTLPPGLNFSTSTGTISGTPTTVGTYSGLAESVTDSASHTANLAANPFQIAISNGGSSPGTLDLGTPTAVTGLISIF